MQKKSKSIAGSIRPFVSVVVLLLLTVSALPGKTSAVPASNAVQRVLVISSVDRLP